MSQPMSPKNKGKAPLRRKVSVHFEESQESTITEPSSGESGCEIEDWESDLDGPVDRNSSPASVIMAATPLPKRQQPPYLPQTPLRQCHVSPLIVGRSVESPIHRVTRSRTARS